MPTFYLSPASISSLNQTLIAALISAYLALRMFRRRGTMVDWMLLFFMMAISLFFGSFFLETSLLPSDRLFVVFLEMPLFGLSILPLIQFAYLYPVPLKCWRFERPLALAFVSAFILLETIVAGRRFVLIASGQMEYRPPWMDFPPIFLVLWVIITFVRSIIQNRHRDEGRQLAIVFSIPFALTLINLARTFELISTPFYYICMAVGVLTFLFFLTLIYLSSQPETLSLQVRISGAVLTAALAMLGVLAWLTTPAYTDLYRPQIVDHRSLRFEPVSAGGYRVEEIPFHFEENMGERLGMNYISSADYVPPDYAFESVDFAFPLGGRTYPRLFIMDDGAITFGEALDYRDLESHFSPVPAVFGLLLDLMVPADGPGGVYLRRDPEQLVITYNQVPAYSYPENRYTFQIVLRTSGAVEITTNGLPEKQYYFTNDRPYASIWAMGIKTGTGEPPAASFASLPATLGPQGGLRDENRAFRQYQNTFVAPLATTVLSSGLVMLLILPLIFNRNLGRPLDALIAGVDQLNQGHREVNLPVRYNDEIGYLTRSFNAMASELNASISELETRVAERTADLQASNRQLRSLSTVVEQSPSAILITGLDAKIRYSNPAYTALTGFSSEEMRGQDARDFISEQTHLETTSGLRDSLSRGLSWRGEIIHRKKDGNTFWQLMAAVPLYDENGAVNQYAVLGEDITQRKLAEQELERLAITDPLTGLFNRRHFFAEAQKVFARGDHAPYQLAVLIVDIDFFKRINDTYGHQMGDAVLVEVGRRIQLNLRVTDLLARYGGEEFAILLPRTSRDEARLVAARLVACFDEHPIPSGGASITVTISLGVALLDGSTHELDELLSQADQAMYQAKRLGRNRWAEWQPALPV